VTLLYLVSSLAIAAPGTAQPTDDSARPKAVMTDGSHDFGEVARADVVETTFILHNEGTAALEILGSTTNCPCAALRFPESISPGESADIYLEVDTDLIDGAFEGLGTLFTNDLDRPQIEISFKVATKPYVFAYPGYIRYVVPQYRPGTGVVSQRVWAEEPVDFHIVRVESPYPFITTSFHEVAVEDRIPEHDGPQWLLETTLAYDAPVGPLSGFVRIFTDHEKQAKVSIPLSGFVRPLFALTPAESNFGDVEIDQEPIRAPLNFKYFGSDPIALREVESDIDGITFEVEPIVEGREYWIYITLPVSMPKGAFSGQLRIHTTSQKQPIVAAPIFGVVR
jgi:hypothetical protein